MMSRPSRQSFLMVPTARGNRTKLKVAEGRFYQIVHANLPPRSPPWLKSIRIVMVSDADKSNVTIKFPSAESIEGCSFNQEKVEFGPDLDKSFIMGFKLAQRVLRWEVELPGFNSAEEIETFWLVRTPKLEIDDVPLRDLRAIKREDKRDEMALDEASKLAIVKVEVKKEEIFGDEEDSPKMKKYKWWSNDSFEAGKKVILRVLKDMNASLENPIFRIALRKEAQKEIGNTGLLDHLLKEIPGKVAPDGASRFQRCYNADGVIMYWLESADLVDLRKKAGVADPFWVPPPNWKIGSCSTGCSCSKELEQLKEELAQVKRDLEETQKQLDEVRASNDIRRCNDCSNWVGGFW